MIINETAWGDASLLVDEQTLSGDPLNNNGGSPQTSWFIGYDSWLYPASAVIDLGGIYNISTISIYDANGTGNLTVSGGAAFNWIEYFNDPMDSYLRWKNFTINSNTRYVKVQFDAAQGCPGEIVIYGTLVEPAVIVVNPVERERPAMDKFIGVNGFIDDPAEILKVAGHVREYHNWNWNEGNGPFGDPSASTYQKYPNNAIKVNPSYPGWWFDDYYEDNISDSLDIFPCIQSSVSWLTAGGADKPVVEGSSCTIPSSYKEHAHFMYQYAARYGSKTVADNLIILATGQTRVTGLNYLTYFENWNEQDRWWEGREAYFTPYEFAAMSSADYDGHLGTMGDHFGVKTADPDAKFVMGGLAGLKLDYIKAMKFWSDHHRGGSFPAEVLNFHHYSNDAESNGTQTVGISPEADNVEQKLKELVDYRDTHLPDMEIWLTEFGYDTDPGSIQRAPVIDTLPQQEVQGMWLIRYYLICAAAGLDRATMYMIRDVGNGGPTKYSTSGLTSSRTNGHVKKRSWYYVYTLKNTLKGYRFQEEVSSGRADVKIYKFRKDDGKVAYALWCPTSENKIVSNYDLPVTSGINSVKMIKLKNGLTSGEQQSLPVINNTATLNVSEKPIFILEETSMVTSSLKLAEETVKVSPTLVSDKITIEVPLSCNAEILNMQGKKIKKLSLKEGNQVESLADLQPGVYIIVLHSGAERITKKIVKD